MQDPGPKIQEALSAFTVRGETALGFDPDRPQPTVDDVRERLRCNYVITQPQMQALLDAYDDLRGAPGRLEHIRHLRLLVAQDIKWAKGKYAKEIEDRRKRLLEKRGLEKEEGAEAEVEIEAEAEAEGLVEEVE